MRVGDVAEINGTHGLVEAIHLRTIVLRDQRGAVYVIPCGSITSLANLTKDFAYAVLDLRAPSPRHRPRDRRHSADGSAVGPSTPLRAAVLERLRSSVSKASATSG